MKNKRLTAHLKIGMSMIITALTVVTTANAIEMSPIISNGESKDYSEAETNLWFVIDDSGSMGYTKCDGNDYCRIYYGYIDYDPNTTYVLPKTIKGDKDMPLPEGTDQMYLSPFRDELYRFAYNADLSNKRFDPWFDLIDVGEVRYGTKRWYSSPLITTCGDQKDVKNCKIWQNYYLTRMRVLKSAMSLSMFSEDNKEKIKRLRIGYTGLNGNSLSSRIEGRLRVNDAQRSRMTRSQKLPVIPLYTSKGDTHKTDFKFWLYNRKPEGGTPIRSVVPELYQHIWNEAAKDKTRDRDGRNPFIKNPGKPYNATTNPLLTCRRNYVALMADGGWSVTSNYDARDALAKTNSTKFIKNNSLAKNEILPRTKGSNKTTTYKPMPPYNRKVKILSGYRWWRDKYNYTLTLGDIAFAGWKTDMDGDDDNNDITPKYTKIDGVIQKNNGSSYWHPYNDPATWQHFNMLAIGFGLSNKDIQINPPNLNPDYLKSGYKWTLDVRRYSNDGDYSGRDITDDSAALDMANAALASRGRFYPVNTAEELKNTFNDIINVTSEPVEKPGTRAAAGASGSPYTVTRSFFISRYDGESFTGDLIKYNLFDGDPNHVSACFNVQPPILFEGLPCDKPAKIAGTSSEWNAAKELTKRTTSRHLITMKRMKKSYNTDLRATDNPSNLAINQLKYQQMDFSADTLSAYQKQRLITNFPNELKLHFDSDTERLQKLVAYIKGDDEYEDTRFRNRSKHKYIETEARSILGALTRSSPVYSGIPKADISNLNTTSTAYSNYISFVNNYKSGDKDMLYIGSNDGMLHAFKASDASEAFAYIPNAVYDRLSKTVTPKTMLSTVNGNLSVAAVNFGSSGQEWRKMLVGAMGDGAKGLYALNVTNPLNKNNKVAWEYSDLESKLYQKSIDSQADTTKLKSNIGHIFAKPAIIQLHDGTWAAIVGNGYNSESEKAAVIVINLQTGKVIQELVLENTEDDYTMNDKENGLGPLSFVKYPGKPKAKSHLYDRAYAGDFQGNLWVFDLTESNKTDGIKVVKRNNRPTPLFTAKTTIGTNETEQRQAITVAPLVLPHPQGYGYLVHFGTGALFKTDDITSRIPNTVYAIWDDWVSADNGGLPSTMVKTVVVKKDQLNPIVFNTSTVTVKDASGNNITQEIRQLSSTNQKTIWAMESLSVGRRGWYVNLPTGERAWQKPYVAYGQNNVNAVAYRTVKYDSGSDSSALQEKCSFEISGAKTFSLAFNTHDGAKPLSSSGVWDLNGDNQITAADHTFSTIKTHPAFGVQSNNVGFNSLDQNIDGNLSSSILGDSSGENKGGVTRFNTHFNSWSELK